jgi:hypothetical protein
VDHVPDPLLLTKSGSAENRTRDIWFCSQELWPIDHRGGPFMLHTHCPEFHSKHPVDYPCLFLFGRRFLCRSYARAYICIYMYSPRDCMCSSKCLFLVRIFLEMNCAKIVKSVVYKNDFMMCVFRFNSILFTHVAPHFGGFIHPVLVVMGRRKFAKDFQNWKW